MNYKKTLLIMAIIIAIVSYCFIFVDMSNYETFCINRDGIIFRVILYWRIDK